MNFSGVYFRLTTLQEDENIIKVFKIKFCSCPIMYLGGLTA